MNADAGRVLAAIRPVVESSGGRVIRADAGEPLDVPIEWDGEIIAYARAGSLTEALGNLVSRIEEELGGALPDLDRTNKQIAVRLLDERGAFQLRKSIEDIADIMDVSRITIYNYLNAIRD